MTLSLAFWCRAYVRTLLKSTIGLCIWNGGRREGQGELAGWVKCRAKVSVKLLMLHIYTLAHSSTAWSHVMVFLKLMASILRPPTHSHFISIGEIPFLWDAVFARRTMSRAFCQCPHHQYIEVICNACTNIHTSIYSTHTPLVRRVLPARSLTRSQPVRLHAFNSQFVQHLHDNNGYKYKIWTVVLISKLIRWLPFQKSRYMSIFRWFLLRYGNGYIYNTYRWKIWAFWCCYGSAKC